MRRVERLARLLAAFLILYGLVVVIPPAVATVRGEARPSERFPFFAWSLFSEVPPAERARYGLRFLSIDGEVLDPPLYFEEADGLIQNNKAPAAQMVIGRLGKAVEQSNPAFVASQRWLIESTHLQEVESAEYEIVYTRSDIIDRIECGCFLEETPVARFRYPEGQP